MSKSELRSALRTARRSLSTLQQKFAAKRLLRTIKRQQHIVTAKRIALYFANDGEVMTSEAIDYLLRANKQVYLPATHANRTLTFHRLPQNRWRQRLRKGPYGIIEPKPSCPSIDVKCLDLLIMPLVGVDTHLQRLGMGGGFYDRTLAFKQRRTKCKPKLIGLAHQCQKVNQLPTNEWDISLDSLILV